MSPLPEQTGLFRFLIGRENEGRRLDHYLATKFRRSRTSLKERLDGCVFGEAGHGLRWSHRLRAGETIVVRSEVRPEPKVEVVYRILFQDQWLVVVDKGAGAPVHPVRGFRTRTILTRLREELQDPQLQLAHRLDRETSGVLLLGRETEVLKDLMIQFQRRQVQKRYLAIVRGEPQFDALRVELPLSLDTTFPVRCRMKADPVHGQKAITDFRILRRCGDRSLVEALPRTGRQHQIRLHLASIGHPVLGDKLYQEEGRPYLEMIKDSLSEANLMRLGHHRQALHAEQLSLRHPKKGTPVTFVAPLAPDMKKCLPPIDPEGLESSL